MKKVLYISRKVTRCGVHDYGERIVSILKKSTKYKYVVGYPQDRNEMLELIARHNPQGIIYNYYNSTLDWVKQSFADSLEMPQIIIYHESSVNFRPDGICDFNNPICTDELLVSNVYVPTRELVRHFDGYGHVGKLNNISPPLFIPKGFFEKEIKIKYGFNERDNEYTNFNPSSEFLYAYSNEGTDYR